MSPTSLPPALTRLFTHGTTRRDWLARNAAAAAAALTPSPTAARAALLGSPLEGGMALPNRATDRVVAQAELLDPTPLEALARRAVEAAMSAGAAYADARLTRDIVHWYSWGGASGLVSNAPGMDVQTLGIGVRALVKGYWGFSSSTIWEPDEAARLGTEAVAVAKVNATGPARSVELGRVPVATGRWATPVKIDPFTVPFEEIVDHIVAWDLAIRRGHCLVDSTPSWVQFARQERAVATSEGSLFTQVLYESGGVVLSFIPFSRDTQTKVPINGIGMAALGLERFLDADIEGQARQLYDRIVARQEFVRRARPVTVGSYTLVCDGATMAAMAAHTLGVATQLDRALGYEANAGGTSYLDDPLAMVGQVQIASPVVTLTGDRSTSQALGTVKWDDEGIEPDTVTLVKDGVLTDFQTTRESSTWLTDYYTKKGQPVRSHGHLVAGAGVHAPIQQMPNLALATAPDGGKAADLAAGVKDGLYVENGSVRTDFQAKNGTIEGDMQIIRNGRLEGPAVGGAVLFSTADFWKRVSMVGGAASRGELASSRFLGLGGMVLYPWATWWYKGEPPQANSHTASAPAALVSAQAIIDPSRRA